MEFILSSPSSLSDFPLFCQGMAFAHLDSLPPHDLVIWTDGSVPFSFGKGGSGVLANCSLCGTEITAFFRQASFSAEACAILQALCWSWQYQQVCHFFSSLTLSLSSPPCPRHPVLSSVFLFNSISLADLAGSVFSLLPFYQATMGPWTVIPSGNDAADELVRRGALLVPSAIPCTLFSFTSRIQSCLFSD